MDFLHAGPGFRRAALTALALLAPWGSPRAGQVPTPAAQATPARRIAELRRKIEADNRSNPVASIGWAEEALGLLEGAPDAKSEIWFQLGLVRDLNNLSEYAQATTWLAKARALVARAGEPRDHFILEIEAASILAASERPGESMALLDTLLPALAAYRGRHPEDLELGRFLGRGYRILGSSCRFLGRFPQAIAAYQRGQQVCAAVGDHKGEARTLDLMGTLYANLGRLDEAVASHRMAIAGAEALGELDMQALFHLSLANTFGSRNEPDLQLSEMKIAGDLAARTGDADIQLTVAVNLADGYLRKKDFRSTLKYADAGMKLATQAQNPSSIAVCLVNRGIALNRLGSSAEGLKAIQQGLEHFKTTQALPDEAEITGNLAEEYAFAGDFRKAYETEVQFKALVDNLSQAQDRKHIAEASASFENDKKQIEINALYRDQRNQARLRLLWIALGTLGFGIAGVLVLGRKKLTLANRTLAEMSLRDPLTSLANRRYLTTRIAEDLAQINRNQRSRHTDAAKDRLGTNIDVVFLMIDIDNFKQVNDQHGHASGDQVLKQFAFILAQTMRDSDTVVRWGGEEFFVVAKHTSRADASQVAERIRSRVEAFPFELGNGEIIHKTCSVGYACYPFFRTDPGKLAWEKVAEIADQCLYAAKVSGRNTWVGVHENGNAAVPFAEALGAYPDVAQLVASGSLEAASRDNRRITWPS